MFFTDILSDLHRLQNEMTRSFGDSVYFTGDFPGIQIYANKDHLIVRSEAPGLSADDFSVSITEDILTISGEIKRNDIGDDARLIRNERRTGKFQKTIELPYPVEADNSEATLKNGILTISLPIKEAVKPRQINIKAE